MKRTASRAAFWVVMAIGLAGCAGQRLSAPPALPAGAPPETPNAYFLFVESQLHRLEGKPEAALEALQSALAKDPGSTYLKWELARLYREQKESQKALEILEEILAADPEETEALRLYAQILQEMERLDPAAAAYEKLIGLDPDQEKDYLLLGRLYLSQGRQDDAFRIYRRLVRRFPGSFVGHFFIGKIQRERGQHPGAERSFRKALQLEPDLVEPRFELVRLYRSEGYGFQPVAVQPGETVGGIARRIYGRFDDKVRAAVRIANPGVGDLETVRSGQQLRFPWPRFLEAGSVEAALDRLIVDTYQDILAISPGNVQASIELGLWHRQQGRRAAAEEIFRRLGERSLTENAVLTTVVRQYFEQDAFAEVEAMLQDMLKEAPDSPHLHYVMGLTLNEMDRKEGALRNFRAVDPASEFYENAAINIAYILQQQDAMEEAIRHMEQAVETLPDNVEFKLYLGSFYEEVEDYDKAEATLRRALDLDGDNPKVHFRLGVVLDKQGRKDDSMDSMKTVIRLDPEHANALNYLGYTYADLGIRLDEAEELIRRALKQRPDDGYITDSLGWVYYRRGDYRRALEIIRRAVELVPDDPVILEHMGDVYRKLENPEKALEYYRKSLELQEGDASAIEEKIREVSGGNP